MLDSSPSPYERKLFIDQFVGFDFSGLQRLIEDAGGWAAFVEDPDARELLGYVRPYLDRLSRVCEILKRHPIYGYLPNTAQDRFHYNPARGRGCFWPNRMGKSFALCTEGYAHATGNRWWLLPDDPLYKVARVPVPNVGRLYVTTYDRWEQDLQPEWETIAGPPGRNYTYAKTNRQINKIRFPNKSVIYLMTDKMDPKASEGGRVHWAGFNEPVQKAHFTATIRGLMDTGGPWWMNMTLIDTDRWIYDEIWEMAQDDPDIAVIEGHLDDNLRENGGILTPEYIADTIKFYSPEERDARIYGIPTFATGRIFPTYRKEHPYYVPVFSPDPAWPTFCFLDPADKKPIAVLYLTVDPHAGYVFARYEIYDGSLTTVKDVADAMKEYEATLPGGVALRWMDSSGKTMERTSGNCMAEEFAKNGLFFDFWPKADKVNTQIKQFRQWLKLRENGLPTFMVTESCNRLGTFEIPKYHYDKNGKPVKKNDDLLDCAMAAAVVDIISLARDLMRDAVDPDEHVVVASWTDHDRHDNAPRGPSGGY
jgi:hypothetical protein